jgi:serine protease Do
LKYNQLPPMKRLASKLIIHRALVLGGAACIASTSLALNSTASADDQSKNSALNLKIDESPLNSDQDLKSSYAPIVQKVAPSVVKVFVPSSIPDLSRLSDPDSNYFRYFFSDIPWQSGSLLEHTLGSAVIVSPDGYILTNNHVVKNAKEIQVALNDGRTFTAKVIGTDSQTDIALIRVQADNLSALTFADSDKVNVGDVVLAVGNPFGVGQTVSSGIVSAKNRVTSSDLDEDFIQIDATINPGNSGGALVDTDGRLIGITTAILSRSGGNRGIGLAIPSNLCRWVMENLVKFGHVNRGFLGVEIQDLTPGLAQAFKINNTQGALVSEVTPGSAAAAAGLQSGDVIIRFNDQSVQDASQLKLQVAETGPGITVTVGVVRNGENETFSVTLKEQPNNEMASANLHTNQDSSDKDALHGVTVSDLDHSARVELSIPADVHGALVTEVDPTSPAYEAGIRTGDLILEINREPIKNAQDAVKDTAKPMGNEILVKIWGQGGIHYISVPDRMPVS